MSRLRSIIVAAALVVPAGTVSAPAAEAAGSVRSALSLSAPASGVYGSTIALRGRLWRYGSTGIRGALVTLQRKPHGRTGWRSVRSTRTGTNGVYAFGVTQTALPYDYRVYFAGSSTYTRAYSPVRYPVVTQKVLLDHIQTWDFNTGELRATGRVFPVPPNGTRVWLQRWTGSSWANLAAGRSSRGQVAVLTTRPGSVASYRLAVGSRGLYGAGASPARVYAHYVWRGAFVKPVRLVYADGSGGIYIRPRSQDPTQSTVEVRSTAQGRVTTELDIEGVSAHHDQQLALHLDQRQHEHHALRRRCHHCFRKLRSDRGPESRRRSEQRDPVVLRGARCQFDRWSPGACPAARAVRRVT